MLSTVHSPSSTSPGKHVEAVTWGTIFGSAAMAIGMLFWMGAASHAGEPLATVLSIGLGAVGLAGVGAIVAVWFSRRP